MASWKPETVGMPYYFFVQFLEVSYFISPDETLKEAVVLFDPKSSL